MSIMREKQGGTNVSVRPGGLSLLSPASKSALAIGVYDIYA